MNESTWDRCHNNAKVRHVHGIFEVMRQFYTATNIEDIKRAHSAAALMIGTLESEATMTHEAEEG